MSILIKGIEMPTEGTVIAIYKLNGKFYASMRGTELCPLVPVPPHGDLVDRDALMELYADEDDLRLENMKVPIAVIRQNIMDMPTIIPADEPFGKSEQLNVKGE